MIINFRPFGCTLLLSCYLNGKAELWTIDPSGAAFGYKGATAGKAKNNAKTEIEKLDLENITVDQALKEAARIIHSVHDEVKGQFFKLTNLYRNSKGSYPFQKHLLYLANHILVFLKIILLGRFGVSIMSN